LTLEPLPSPPEEIIAQLALPSLGEHPAENAEEAGKVELVANAIIKIEEIEDRMVLSRWYYLLSCSPYDVMRCCNCSYQLF
jgi:hypothetical protein